MGYASLGPEVPPPHGESLREVHGEDEEGRQVSKRAVTLGNDLERFCHVWGWGRRTGQQVVVDRIFSGNQEGYFQISV